jgi:hypothetical protein
LVKLLSKSLKSEISVNPVTIGAPATVVVKLEASIVKKTSGTAIEGETVYASIGSKSNGCEQEIKKMVPRMILHIFKDFMK